MASSSSSPTATKEEAITSIDDVIVVRDRYLYTYRESIKDENDENRQPKQRFLMKGIAFPNAPNLRLPSSSQHEVVVLEKEEQEEGAANTKNPYFRYEINYNATNWIAILKQLRSYLPSTGSLNTLRLYELYPQYIDYGEFFHEAAKLGFYIIVPFTSNVGRAILNRDVHAPHCYNETYQELYDYGITAIRTYMKYPNIIAGVIGNEVINSLDSWKAAPCIKAYARDLQYYMKHTLPKEIQQRRPALRQKYQQRLVTVPESEGNEVQLLPIPLLYAAQDSGIGAALNEVDTVRLSLDYLTCQNEQNLSSGSSSNSNNSGGTDAVDDGTTTSKEEELAEEEDDYDGFGSIDILGVNVESWCSSCNTFQYQDDGITPGTFYQLWLGLHTSNVHIPLVFSEIGCSHLFYNRDLSLKELLQCTDSSTKGTNSSLQERGVRDWNEIPVVMNDMVDTWSGFCAYAYWGNSLFNMMEGGPWNGKDVLLPGQDFINFQKQCLLVTTKSKNNTTTITSAPPSSSVNSNTKTVSPFGLHPLPLQNGGVMDDYYQLMDSTTESPTCEQVEQTLEATINLKLYPWQDIPSYIMTNQEEDELGFTSSPSSFITTMQSIPPRGTEFHTITNNHAEWKRHRLEAMLLILGVGIALSVYFFCRQRKRKQVRQSYDTIP